jgi:hypothetical protein
MKKQKPSADGLCQSQWNSRNIRPGKGARKINCWLGRHELPKVMERGGMKSKFPDF